MEFDKIENGKLIKTKHINLLPQRMHGTWVVKKKDEFSFSISRINEDYMHHFSPCASLNFEEAV